LYSEINIAEVVQWRAKKEVSEVRGTDFAHLSTSTQTFTIFHDF
jgi:hypothetical protein